ncbi:hypothetical protein B0H13DRAFT_2402140 [Mycena leptocephala]|nr:hypothetical protein B0H13DRAFT_2402140 [Mycena leptocephala]
MPPQPTVTEIRLRNITSCLTMTANTLEILSDSLKNPSLDAICNTTQSLLKHIEGIYGHSKTQYRWRIATKCIEAYHDLHQGEMSTLLKECKAGLQKGRDFFQIKTVNIMKDITEMQEDSAKRHKEMLGMIEALSDTLSSDAASSHQFFIACDSAATQVELAALIGAHLGLKPGKDLTCPVIQYFSSSPHSLLILDNLETVWEPTESRGNIEEFLSLLTGVDHLALVITMRGAERPAKVAWTRPFLPPLKPLETGAARQTFIDIADGIHNPEEIDKVLSLTDNLPFAINLVAHLVDSEGCSNVLSCWEEEKTSLISDGYNRGSNLDLSISLSLSSPRLNSLLHAKDLLSLLSMLPDGLSDIELVQSKLQIDNILGCKAALIRTTLAYSNEHKRLKTLAPIREYMQKIQPPGDHLIRPLLKHFQELLECYMEYCGTQLSSSTVAQISSNYSNIQNVLQNGLQQGHPDLITDVLPRPCDHRLEAYFIIEWLNLGIHYSISDPGTLVSETIEHFKQFDDSDLKCRFYNVSASYYRTNIWNFKFYIELKFCYH